MLPHAPMVHVTRNFTKSDEFRGKSVQIPRGIRKASVWIPCMYCRYYSCLHSSVYADIIAYQLSDDVSLTYRKYASKKGNWLLLWLALRISALLCIFRH